MSLHPHHFIVPSLDAVSARVALTAQQSHHITRVLRLRAGDEIVVLDGRGAQWRARLRLDGTSAWGEIVGPAHDCHEPRLHVTLMAGPPRGAAWEWLLQKGTEVGVARFVPLVTRYTQPGAATVKPRHHEIVREATEQCRRLLLPEIAPPRPFAEALAEAAGRPDTATVLLWEGEPATPLVAELRPALARGCSEIVLVAGPEGGFHPDEAALASALGVPTASLGPLTLRAETAGIVGAAIALSLSN
jgi:16S rRNA (uracil1498-N3)-methyltransferase